MRYLVLLMFVTIGCDAITPETKTTIRYEVSGTYETANIRYDNGEGGTDDYNDVPLPWSKTVEVGKDDLIQLSAHPDWDAGSGSITVEIFREGRSIESSTSNGDFPHAIATVKL